MSSGAWRFVGTLAGIAGIVVIWLLVDAKSEVEILGTSAQVWVAGLVLYVLGVLAGVGAARGGKPGG